MPEKSRRREDQAVAPDHRCIGVFLCFGRVVEHGGGQWRVEKSRRDGVACHAVRAPVFGSRPRELHHATLRRAIRPAVIERARRLQRRNVDDAAPALGLHPRGAPARDEERSSKIDRYRRVPIVVGQFGKRVANVDASAVDQNIRRAIRQPCFSAGQFERVTVGEIDGDAGRLNAVPLHFGAGYIKFRQTSRHQHELRAMTALRVRNGFANSRAAAGDDGDVIVEIK